MMIKTVLLGAACCYFLVFSLSQLKMEEPQVTSLKLNELSSNQMFLAHDPQGKWEDEWLMFRGLYERSNGRWFVETSDGEFEIDPLQIVEVR